MADRQRPLRVLFFGDPNSGYEGYFARHLHADGQAEVEMLTFASGQAAMWQEHLQYFRRIHYLRGAQEWPLLRQLGRLWEALRRVAALPEYDVCHVQFYSPKKALFLPLLRRKCRTLVISFWGSDVNKTSWLERQLQIWGLRFADRVTFQNDGLRQIFCTRYRQPERSSFRTIWLGLDLMGVIHDLQHQGMDRAAAKRALGIDPQRVCITCGTYASRDQNHLAIIAALEERFAGRSQEIQLLVPLTYGDREYRAEVVARLAASPLAATVYESFLPDGTAARLWLASDILVQVLSKDAFSGATQECLYAGGVVITGSWLPYGILKERGVRFLEVATLEELPAVLDGAVRDLERLRRDFAGNPAIMWSLSSWPSVIQRWLELYAEGLATGGGR